MSSLWLALVLNDFGRDKTRPPEESDDNCQAERQAVRMLERQHVSSLEEQTPGMKHGWGSLHL